MIDLLHGKELEEYRAAVDQRKAAGVSAKILAYGITDTALDALNNRKTRRIDSNGGN